MEKRRAANTMRFLAHCLGRRARRRSAIVGPRPVTTLILSVALATCPFLRGSITWPSISQDGGLPMTTATRDPQYTTTRRLPTHSVWQEQQGIPIHRGYYVEDLRTVEVGDWKARGVKAAFVQLEGMPGVTEIR